MNARIVDTETDLKMVVELLKASNLPHLDIQLAKGQVISYHDDRGEVVGSGGLEFYGPYGLLRSVAVTKSQRGKSIGKEIVQDLLARARSKPIKELYLLTETAQSFFLSIGFKEISRGAVPNEVKESSEFKSVCPDSAKAMTYRL